MSKETDPVFASFADRSRAAVDAALAAALPPAGPDGLGRLGAAMRHAVLGGGKRLRPLTVLAAAEAVGGGADAALPGAVAVELVHAYSLVHDDLPAMDDDVERRGRPTVHVAFDEATAILAGDALLTLAFEVLTAPGAASAARRAASVLALARLSGHAGLVGGQSLDIEAGEAPLASLAALERIHRGKTAALFQASTLIGGHLGGGDDQAVATLGALGEALGLAFQHADDRLDREHLHLAAETGPRLFALLDTARTLARAFGPRGGPLLGLIGTVEEYAG
jgi:geranylgeranyl pyrophosphate synthase